MRQQTMSSGVDTPDDFKHYPQSVQEDLDLEDLSVSQSSILYLLQEATKLATPSNHYSLDTEGLHSKEETLSMPIPCHPAPSDQQAQKKNSEVQPSFTGAFSVLNDVQTSSPWEVMSLINLQCERLLHCEQMHGEKVEVDPCTSSKTDDFEHTVVMESSSSVPTVHGTYMVFSREDTVDSASDVWHGAANIIDSTCNLLSNQIADDHDNEKAEAVEDLAELISKNTAGISHFGNATVMSEGSTENSFLVEASVVPLVVSKDVEGCDQPPTPFHAEVGEMVSASSTSEAPQAPNPEISSIDFTSSLVEEKDSLCFAFTACENPEPHNVDVSAMAPQSTLQDSLSTTDFNNNLEDNKEETLQLPCDDQAAPSAQRSGTSRRRTPRKQSRPARSPDLQDPELQGVTFSMHAELDRSTDQCRLLITSNFSKLCRRGRRSRSSRSRSQQSSQRASSSEEESDPAGLSKKICASCCTRKTPLWRDAEDGTPLCNACGIRYKKYRVRCLQCWNIPRKEANSNSTCLKCGDLLQLASQNKHTGW
ncbi:GATA-type zinc finger protein 1 isoform X2 [Pygocentrus nattereri]|uniref:GATA-type zinc finger protein 1 isoform X2 n=1 Tax=Pygocentrus nattereri TaxID=42514 RepID=UPI00081453DB|nr:GATA-type zinc finger protein 1 isoform X2 [Pygocentrus nattereri]